jgi:hypothetical protein
MLSDRFTDRGIEATVQRIELFDADRRFSLERTISVIAWQLSP